VLQYGSSTASLTWLDDSLRSARNCSIEQLLVRTAVGLELGLG